MESGNPDAVAVADEQNTNAKDESKEVIVGRGQNVDTVEINDSSVTVVSDNAEIVDLWELTKDGKITEETEKKDEKAVLEESSVKVVQVSKDKAWISKESFDKLPPKVEDEVPLFQPILKMSFRTRATSTTVVKVDVKGESQDLRITSIPVGDSSKIVKIEAGSMNQAGDSDSKENSDLQYMPSDMNAKQKVELLKENLETAIQAKENIQDDLMEELNSSAKKFVKEAKRHVEKYNQRLKNVVDENTKLVTSLREFLLGKILYIPKVTWQKMMDERTVPRPAKSLGGYRGSSWGKKQPLVQIKPISMSKNHTITLLDLAKRASVHVPADEQRKTEAVVAMIDKNKVELQRKANAKMIVEFFPYMTFEDAEVCLKCNNDNLEKVQNILADFTDQFEVLEAIDKMKAKLATKVDDMKFADLAPPEYTSTKSTALPPCVAGKIVDFSEDCSVLTIQLLRDRNRIPLKSGVRRRFRIIKFLKYTWYFTDNEKFEKGLKEQRLHIQYQVDEKSGDMIPLKLSPVVRYAEYKFNWNSRSRKLNSVAHQQDGEILYEANEVETHIYDDKPLRIYTHIIDDSSINILMILLTDTRDNISVESFNLTHTNKTIEDFMTEFNVDISGKKLNYRIIVKDGEVQAVLAPTKKPGECERVKFMEQKVPCEGALISSGTKIGTLKSIPTGLIVTNNPAGIKKKMLQFQKRPGPETWGRHISDLSGFVDVHVLVHDEELLPEPRAEAWNVCEFQLADQGEKDLLKALKTKYISVNDCELFETKVEELDAFLANAPKNDDSLKIAQGKLTEIRKLERTDEVQNNDLPKKHKTKLRSFVRELRLMKLGN